MPVHDTVGTVSTPDQLSTIAVQVERTRPLLEHFIKVKVSLTEL